MENFNLKKFLVENKLTTNSRMLNENYLWNNNITKYTSSNIKEESTPTGNSTPHLEDLALQLMKKAGIPSRFYVDNSAVPTEEGYRYMFKIWKDSHTLPQELTNDIEKKTKDIGELTSILKDKIEGGEFSNFDRGPGKNYIRTELIYIGEVNNDYEFMVEVEEGYNPRE
jgi:hypothetical protein